MTDEEKAKEWVRTNSGYSTKEFHGQKAIEAYLAGAEFGYNKANEWHYPSKGEYPKEGEDVLCYCKCRTEIKFYCVGHTIIGGDNKIRWWSSDRSEKLNVIAWKDITPPKEIKENEN